MTLSSGYPLPKLELLPASLPLDGAVRLELQEGLPILKASITVQRRITALLRKHQDGELTQNEAEELERYEEIDDYLSLLNRLVRNQFHPQSL